MPQVLKKRKTLIVAPANRGIAAFGRISKPQPQSRRIKQDSKIKKVVYGIDIDSTDENQDVIIKKRKLENSLETPSQQKTSQTNLETDVARAGAFSENPIHEPSSPSLPPLQLGPVTPRKKLLEREKLKETPTKGARTYLESLALAPSSPLVGRSSPLLSPKVTPPTSPISDKASFPIREQPAKLPDEVQDLINLHSSFLTALSIYYAHHGSFVPADLRVLAPSIERSWRKRKIHIIDLQRIFGIAFKRGDVEGSWETEEAGYPLSLSDYGHNKLCVEFGLSANHSAQGRSLNIEALKIHFSDSIRHLWSVFPTLDPTTFLTSLPLAPIKPCSALTKISPLLAKGQRRLEDLKEGAIKAQASNKITLPTSPQTFPLEAISTRSSSLLERIRAKELRQSILPGAPSPEILARKSALQRLEEVVPVLEILTGSGSHDKSDKQAGSEKLFSFTMPTVVQHLQTSLRNPISKDEAMRCVRLLAREITPEWVSLREIGKVSGVTVRRGKGPGREEFRMRVRDALGKNL